jgi:hypothetical protein
MPSPRLTTRGACWAFAWRTYLMEQTDGEPLAEPNDASGDPGDKTALLKRAILAQGVAVESVDDLGGALGTSSRDESRLLNGLSPAMEFTTLVHEYAHLCSAVGYVRSGPGEVGPGGPAG